jgi:hypothetical protein
MYRNWLSLIVATLALLAPGPAWGGIVSLNRFTLDLTNAKETEPVAVGLSWRPTMIATIWATVRQPSSSGMLYARYSADGKHWTTWQLLEEAAPAKEGVTTQQFHGTLAVPYREREGYAKLRLEYARRDDVPWGADEEALVKDILGRDPTFFERCTPFIGYVQFLYEAQLPGGHRLQGLDVHVSWSVGGLHRPPKDGQTRKGREGPWRFKAP